MAERNRVEELKKEMQMVMERQLEILMKDDRNMELIDNSFQFVASLRELMKLKHNDQQGDQALMKTRDDIYGAENSKHKLRKLLEKIPCPVPSGDIVVLKDLHSLISESPAARAVFGQTDGPLAKLLNRTLVWRTYFDDPLRGLLVSTLAIISNRDEETSSKIVHKFTDLALPFLVTCLANTSVETRMSAADVLYQLSSRESNREVVGESGAIKALVEIIRRQDLLCLPEAGGALLNLCRSVVENRGRAVAEGAVGAAIGKVKSRVLEGEMLEILVVLSGDGEARRAMEEEGMMPCLFKILTENVEEKCTENCVGLIETMCVDDVTKINGVENGRRTLESVANIGTTMAKKKASDLLKRLDFESK